MLIGRNFGVLNAAVTLLFLAVLPLAADTVQLPCTEVFPQFSYSPNEASATLSCISETPLPSLNNVSEIDYNFVGTVTPAISANKESFSTIEPGDFSPATSQYQVSGQFSSTGVGYGDSPPGTISASGSEVLSLTRDVQVADGAVSILPAGLYTPLTVTASGVLNPSLFNGGEDAYVDFEASAQMQYECCNTTEYVAALLQPETEFSGYVDLTLVEPTPEPRWLAFVMLFVAAFVIQLARIKRTSDMS